MQHEMKQKIKSEFSDEPPTASQSSLGFSNRLLIYNEKASGVYPGKAKKQSDFLLLAVFRHPARDSDT
jgi:hypothetical protein